MLPHVFDQIINFSLPNIIWDASKALLMAIIVWPLVYIWKAAKISRQLIHRNRPRLINGGYTPEYLADRFIEVWTTETCPSANRTYTPRVWCNAFFYETRIDKELEKLGLITLSDNRARAVKSKVNRMVYRLCKWYLINFMLDSREYYKDLEKNM